MPEYGSGPVIWIVGAVSPAWLEEGWFLIGVFSDKKAAEKLCLDHGFVMKPCRLNKAYGTPYGRGGDSEGSDWPHYANATIDRELDVLLGVAVEGETD